MLEFARAWPDDKAGPSEIGGCVGLERLPSSAFVGRKIAQFSIAAVFVEVEEPRHSLHHSDHAKAQLKGNVEFKPVSISLDLVTLCKLNGSNGIPCRPYSSISGTKYLTIWVNATKEGPRYTVNRP